MVNDTGSHNEILKIRIVFFMSVRSEDAVCIIILEMVNSHKIVILSSFMKIRISAGRSVFNFLQLEKSSLFSIACNIFSPCSL